MASGIIGTTPTTPLIPGVRQLDLTPPQQPGTQSKLAAIAHKWHIHPMEMPATFTARVLRDGKWFVAHSLELPEGNGQGLTENEALTSLRESIRLLLEDRREDARGSLGCGEKLVPLALA